MSHVAITILTLSLMMAPPCNSVGIETTQQPDTETDRFLEVINTIFKKLTPGLDYLGDLPTLPATSCQQIVKFRPKATSDYYWIQSSTGPVRVYCNMATSQCGGGVWTRVAHINMTIPSTTCPQGMERVLAPKRSCRKIGYSGFSSSKFSTFGVPYSKVCGKIIGYQFGSPDAFYSYKHNRGYNTIENCYADGVLISYNSPREHIWTLTAQPDGYTKNKDYGCPCISRSHRFQGTIPRFVGEDYFCETGSPDSRWTSQYYTNHPLWDGKGCGTFPGGCEGTRDPWFKKTFPYTISSDIEMRVCLDQGRNNEDLLIETVEIYVQ